MTAQRSSLRSVAVVSTASFVQLLFQFAIQLLLAQAFGASATMDAYVAAMALPAVVGTVLVSSLGYAFIPVFMEQRVASGEEAAWGMATNFGLLFGLISAVLAAGAVWWADWLMWALQPGFTEEQLVLTARLFRILAWLMLTNSLIGYLQATYHACGSFAVPAFAAVAAVAVTFAYVAAFHLEHGITSVAVGVVLGGVVNVVVQLPLLIRRMHWRLSLDAGTIKCLVLLAPLIAGAAYSNLDPLIDRYLASSMPAGSIAHLGYAWRLTTALLLVGTSGLSIVAFPALASHHAAGRHADFNAEIAYALRFLCFLLVPIVAGLLVYAGAVVEDLFERGAFTSRDTQAVSILLRLYQGVIVAASLGGLAAKVFYAFGDTRTPVVVGAAGFTAGAILKFVLAPHLGVKGLAAATSVYFILNASVLLVMIFARSGSSAFAGVASTIGRSFAATAVSLVIAALILQGNFSLDSIAAGAVGAICYWLAMLVLRDEFAIKLLNFLRRGGSEKRHA